MKLIFLDIDGVLVTPTSLECYRNYKEQAESLGISYIIDDVCLEEAIKNLDILIQKTGAVIVIVSQWRRDTSLGKIKQVLDIAGFEHTDQILDTYDWFCGERKRSKEIEDFVEDFYSDREDDPNYVIIDDSKDYEDYQLKHLVSPDPEKGFSSEDLEKVIKILEGTK